MSEHSKADHDYQTTVATVISVARRARTIFENSSEPAEKRAFLNYLLQNCQLEGKNLTFSMHYPFDRILATSNQLIGLPLLSELRTVDWNSIKQELEFSCLISMLGLETTTV